ncbi:MAG: TonB-dependent receptor [Tannerella sp.]|jgi:TonB-linked SusC/RagA family outer membrane protein|nr:TonB-dependent receptor [Tannerella sp.]
MDKLKILLFMNLCFLFAATSFAQTRTVTGNVTDALSNEPIVGASIFVKGTSAGTTTDIDGNFSLNIPENTKTLTISYIGMQTQEIEISGKQSINIRLSEATTDLDEVIVVAYGSTTRASYTGSAVKISGKEMELRPISNITQAFSGAVAGVQVGNNSGSPGTAPSLRIRGISSINGSNDPLYVVDGVPYENALSSINPEDVESFTILKDASSSALYGSRAAAGVVMITTKKGAKGKPRVSIKVNQSFAKVGMDFYDTVSPEEFYVLNWEKLRNQYGMSQTSPAPVPMNIAAQLASGIIDSYTVDGKTTSYKSVYDELTYNPFNVSNEEIVLTDGTINPNAKLKWADDLDWMNGVRQLGVRSEYTINYSGANDKTDYYVSAAYLNDQGYMKSSYFNRSSVRTNVNSQLTSWFKTGLNINGNISEGLSPSGNSPYYYPLYIGPIYPIHLHDAVTGEYILDIGGNKIYDFGGGGDYGLMKRPIDASHNTIAELLASQDSYRRSLLSAKTYAEFKFLTDFTFTINYKVDLNTYYGTDYTPVLEGTATPGALAKSTSQRLTWNFNQLLEYRKKIAEHHNIDIMGGHEAFSTTIFEMAGDKRVQVMEGIPELSNYAELTGLSSYTSPYNTESYIGRVNYNFDEKYLASFSYRADGSSKFYKDSRWGAFWSAGLAWQVQKESFMKNIEFIDMLKLRSSYGQIGNDGGIGYFAWQSLYSMYPNAGAPGYAATSLGNRNLQWETNINADVALEFGVFNRITGTVEFFQKQSDNMLYPMPLQPSSGFTERDENAFSMRNRGVEVDLTADILKNKDGFSWKIRANATHYKNKVIDMPVEPYRNGTKRIEKGYSIYDYYLRHFIGVDPKTGLTMYTPDPTLDIAILEALPKLDDDTRYTTDDAQAGYFWVGKNAAPKVFGGISTDMTYKDLTLSIRMSYQFGGWTYDSNYKTLMTWSSSYGRTFHKDILGRWQKEGDITNIPRLDGTDAVATDQAADNTDRWLVSNDYFELTAISLNYNLPKNITNFLNIQKASIYGNGELLYRYTKRKGLNVRYAYNGTVDDGYLPATIYTIGVNVLF